MSQYLNFFLKKNAEVINLGYFCTTPARTISSLGAFPYTEDDVSLNSTTFKSYLDTIKEERESTRKYLEQAEKHREEVKETLLKCASKEVAQMFMEQLEDANYSIEDWKEELDRWNHIIDRIEYIFEIWEDNKEWNLYYNNR